MRITCLPIYSSLLVALFCMPIALAQQSQAPPPDYAALARTVVTEMSARQFDKVFARFDKTMADAVSADKLAQIWDQVAAQFGAFQKLNSVQLTEKSGYHVAIVNCSFGNTALNIILPFDDASRIAGLHIIPAGSGAASGAAASSWAAPPYADQSKFHEEAVTVSDGQWKLPGTLTLPNGKGPFPAVVLVSGSGPNDADETVGPNKPFKDLAWGIASRGIAVLRYSKRTHVYGAKTATDPMNMTVKDEYIDDARAAVALLASRPEVDSKRIFLAGHSEGGYVAPRIASGDPQIAGLILLEGEERPLEVLVLDQLRYEASLGGPNAAQIEKMIPGAQKEAQQIESPGLKPGGMVSMLGSEVPSSYFLDLRNYDPATVAAGLNIPILVIQGARDYQVTMPDFDGWKKGLAGHSNATFKLFPDVNHLMISGTGPSSPEEYAAPNKHVAAEVIEALSDWIASPAPKS